MHRVHRIIFEGRVIDAVERVLGGDRVEDDFVEVKADWPDPKKYLRQIAGAANRSAGSDIILIVGLDEDGHRLVSPGTIDPETWWSQIRSGFDGGTAPDLVNTVVVSIPSGGSVIALAFETDGAPYVIKAPDGKAPHFEVPIRTATGTGWARRSDLIRMLSRRVLTPNAVPLESDLSFAWHAERKPDKGRAAFAERVSAFAQLRLFIEHLAPEYVMLPHHSMRAEVEIDGTTYPMSFQDRLPSNGQSLPSRHGVESRSDGLLVTGPGRTYVRCDATLPAEIKGLVRSLESTTVRLTMPVIGTDAPVQVTFPFIRGVFPPEPEEGGYASLGNFHLAHT
jgi:hypothetical protein